MMALHESALVALVPEAERLIGACRLAHDPSAALGVPAHVTVLYPFKTPEAISSNDLAALQALFAAQPAFDMTLAELRQFPGVLYLAPEPAEPFAVLTSAVVARYPDWPPYGGAVAEVIPHLTLAQVDDPAQLDEIEAAFLTRCEGNLPIRTRVEAVVLMDNRSGLWRVRETFPLKRE
jgi:2'-5' RNA ligase